MKTTSGEETGTRDAVSTAKFVVDVDIKSARDDMDCGITGSVLMAENRLAITDYDNEKLKVVDTKLNKLTDELKLSSGPTDITKISDDQLAMALPGENKIVLVSTKPELAVQKELQMSGNCWGVCHSEGRLIVTLQAPDKVEIMDTSGSVLQTFDDGENVFCDPECASVSPDAKFIFVSNYGNETIVKLDWDGNVVARYSEERLRYPGNVVFAGLGRLFVCGYMSNTVYQICEDSQEIRLILCESDDLDRPASLCYDETMNRLYIGMKANELKVFQLSP